MILRISLSCVELELRLEASPFHSQQNVKAGIHARSPDGVLFRRPERQSERIVRKQESNGPSLVHVVVNSNESQAVQRKQWRFC